MVSSGFSNSYAHAVYIPVVAVEAAYQILVCVTRKLMIKKCVNFCVLMDQRMFFVLVMELLTMTRLHGL